ncbi:MAG: hypothetical protein NZ700_11070 [Gemmataceae bacterium]|nr:hypothetical protein [Gemmataceae bacterium]MDW8265523.1 hypothetical protein [Gemmataceae bacterium]
MTPPDVPTCPPPSPWLRGIIVGLALVAWFWTQSLIGRKATLSAPEEQEKASEYLSRHDQILVALEPVHRWLHERPAQADTLLIVSSAVIDVLGLFLLLRGILGPTFRPVLGLILVFALRQLIQGLCALPPPPGGIWRHPGFPSLLVTYDVANDLFFSGHTALAVYGAIELGRWGGRGATVAGLFFVCLETAAVLALRAHYTLDVYGGAITAIAMALLADRLAPACDRALTGLWAAKG